MKTSVVNNMADQGSKLAAGFDQGASVVWSVKGRSVPADYTTSAASVTIEKPFTLPTLEQNPQDIKALAILEQGYSAADTGHAMSKSEIRNLLRTHHHDKCYSSGVCNHDYGIKLTEKLNRSRASRKAGGNTHQSSRKKSDNVRGLNFVSASHQSQRDTGTVEIGPQASRHDLREKIRIYHPDKCKSPECQVLFEMVTDEITRRRKNSDKNHIKVENLPSEGWSTPEDAKNTTAKSDTHGDDGANEDFNPPHVFSDHVSDASYSVASAQLVTHSNMYTAVRFLNGNSHFAQFMPAMVIDNVPAAELQVSLNAPPSDLLNREKDNNRWHTIVQVNGLKGSRKEKSTLSSMGFSAHGLTLSILRELDENWMVGFLVGKQKSHVSSGPRHVNTKIDSTAFGPIISWAKNNWHVQVALTLGKNDYAIKRYDALGNKLNADAKGTGLSTYMGLSYDIHLDDVMSGLTITPMVEWLYHRSTVGSFKEKGDSKLAVAAGKSKSTQLTTRYGTEFTYLLPDLEKPTEIGVSFGIQRHRMNNKSVSYSYYQDASYGGATSHGSPNYRDNSVFYGFRAARLINNGSTFRLDYSGTRGKKSKSNSIQLTYEKKF